MTLSTEMPGERNETRYFARITADISICWQRHPYWMQSSPHADSVKGRKHIHMHSKVAAQASSMRLPLSTLKSPAIWSKRSRGKASVVNMSEMVRNRRQLASHLTVARGTGYLYRQCTQTLDRTRLTRSPRQSNRASDSWTSPGYRPGYI